MSAASLLYAPLFPRLSWWQNALLYGRSEVMLYGCDSLRSISHVSRYDIATANGPQSLSIPIVGGRRQSGFLRDVMIDYTHDWKRRHWGTLYSAYGRAPYFEHYAPSLKALLDAGFRRLWELNTAAIFWLNKEMRTGLKFTLVEETLSNRELQIRRESITVAYPSLPVYSQLFAQRYEHLPDLSALDLLMVEGPHAGELLR